uniref:Cytochrome c oxidase subunit 5A, mitochondrial n=1 Tax=Fundulus heteroclitus TaxID=8078 RepID=A0A3Q2PCS8_FUNHE
IRQISVLCVEAFGFFRESRDDWRPHRVCPSGVSLSLPHTGRLASPVRRHVPSSFPFIGLRVPKSDRDTDRLLGSPAQVKNCLLTKTPLVSRCYSHGKVETDEEFDSRWITYFSKPDIDAWELRKGMNTLIGYDLVPEPKILDSALRACRRLDDLASAIRILEAVKDKAGPHKDIYPYVIQELKPTLAELGISTPEELGIDKF